MANPTTNFGWSMPTSSDLVTDLPTDFETFGQGVDTSLAELKGGTTGQVLSKTSGTDMDFTWATPAGGGGMTLLNTTTLSGSSVTISDINQTYTNLFVSIYGINPDADSYFRMNPNGSQSITTAVNAYSYEIITADNTSLWPFSGNLQLKAGNVNNSAAVTIYGYSRTTGHKPCGSVSNCIIPSNAPRGINTSGGIQTNSAITSITFTANGNSFNGGTVEIYGVK